MSAKPYNLAIETSSRHGSVALGRGDELLATIDLPDPLLPPRRSVDLMPAIDELMRKHSATPGELGEAYVSIGPGSFTGLRIAVATVKMLARVLGVKVVAIPTLDVVTRNVTADVENTAHLAVCLNLKRETVYAGVYSCDSDGWSRQTEPALTTLADLLARAPRPLALLGDPLPAMPAGELSQVTVLPASLAQPNSECVWRLGRATAKRGEWTDPATLLPLYVRPPEAVEIWEKRAKVARK